MPKTMQETDTERLRALADLGRSCQNFADSEARRRIEDAIASATQDVLMITPERSAA
jgi:hypothetical protein